MSLLFLEGPAGSGKTTRLFEKLAAALGGRPLAEHERVLALTKMHGSRRRMRRRLSTFPGLRSRFDCTTIDSLAWRVLRRWRSLARTRWGAEPEVGDYDTVCRCAGALLSEGIVGRWATCAFPVVVIDEMQDSKGGQLEVVRALSNSARHVLAAADEFQDLDASGENAAVAWGRQSGEVFVLTQNHRTTATGLLRAADALRSGRAVPANGNGFVALGVHSHNHGAGHVSRNLTWWRNCIDIAVVVPVRAHSSPFVRNLFARVGQQPIGDPAVGPHRIPWEVSQEDQCEQFLSGLGLPADPSAELRASDVCFDHGGPSKTLRVWVDQQRRMAGRVTFTVAEIQQQVRLIHQRLRAYGATRNLRIRAMTIHQAKNREFDSVIVLWPYEVAGSPDRQRRLLYNAITRAKRQAVVIVQNPNRLNHPPFAV